VSDSPSKVRTVLFALLGLGRGGTILYRVLFVLAVPALTVWTVFLPRWRFKAEVEYLHAPVSGDEEILGLDVTVHDTLLVCCC
jgi:hypothetical protein